MVETATELFRSKAWVFSESCAVIIAKISLSHFKNKTKSKYRPKIKLSVCWEQSLIRNGPGQCPLFLLAQGQSPPFLPSLTVSAVRETIASSDLFCLRILLEPTNTCQHQHSPPLIYRSQSQACTKHKANFNITHSSKTTIKHNSEYHNTYIF